MHWCTSIRWRQPPTLSCSPVMPAPSGPPVPSSCLLSPLCFSFCFLFPSCRALYIRRHCPHISLTLFIYLLQPRSLLSLIFRLLVMEHSNTESAMASLIEKTRDLSWGIPPPPSWKEFGEAEHVAEMVLVGRVFVDRDMPLHAIKGVFSKAWSFAAKVEFSVLDRNVFLCEFASLDARNKVLDRLPWTVKGFPMFFHPWPPGLSWQELNLELCPI